MKLAAGFGVFAAANATNLALTWSDCGGLAKISTVTPATIPLGTKTTITGSGTSPVAVTSGTFDATVKAGFIPLASCSGPLGPAKTCTLPLGAGSLTLNAIALPIGPGAASISLDVELAASLPAQLASTTTHATAVNKAGQKVVCIDIDLKAQSVPLSNPPGGVFDDILKVVCQLMENGSTEPEAEELICSKLHYNLEVEACDKVVDLLWKGFENKECPAGAKTELPVNHALVDRINERFARGETTWSALAVEENPFADLTLEQLRAMMGLSGANATVSGADFDTRGVAVPSDFDGRVTFASCQKAVRNQAQCGSCWAFAAAETLTTNLCVMEPGQTVPVLSPQDLVSCDTSNYGCQGGNLNLVWQYIAHKGIRSDACVPYTSGGGAEAACSSSCTGSGPDTHYSCPVGPSAFRDDAAIQAGVVSGGAVEVGFSVYQDFMSYKSGIYKHSEGSYLGGHAVKVVGYGKASSTFYWIVQNSWGPTWGEGGFFRIMNWEEDSASNFARGGGNACIRSSSIVV